jgi:DNA-binding SARP family transcriptional activator
MMGIEYRILGPVEVELGGVSVPIEAPRQRAVLAALLLEANRVVSVERLATQVWGDRPPSKARNTIQSLVLRLRKSITPSRSFKTNNVLITKRPGYLVLVEPGQLDLDRFESMVATGRAAMSRGEPETAASTLRRALDMWRGEPFSDAAAVRLHEVDATRLRERRLQALEERIDADLMLKRHADLVAELPTVIAENPLRERLYGQLMLALYRSGRQGESLEVYQLLRRRLIDELAVEPAAAVRRLHQQILAHEPGLDFTVPSSPLAQVMVRTMPGSEPNGWHLPLGRVQQSHQ